MSNRLFIQANGLVTPTHSKRANQIKRFRYDQSRNNNKNTFRWSYKRLKIPTTCIIFSIRFRVITRIGDVNGIASTTNVNIFHQISHELVLPQQIFRMWNSTRLFLHWNLLFLLFCTDWKHLPKIASSSFDFCWPLQYSGLQRSLFTVKLAILFNRTKVRKKYWKIQSNHWIIDIFFYLKIGKCIEFKGSKNNNTKYESDRKEYWIL